MAHRLNSARPAYDQTFAPESEGDFGIVDEREIAKAREKMNAEYGIGEGRLVVIDDPAQDE